jgi:transglutaminase superfamily protein
MRRVRYVLLALIVVMASCSARPGAYRVPEDADFLIPLGSTLSPTFSTVVSIDDRPYEYAVETDGLGNSWAVVALSDIGGSAALKIRYSVTKRETPSYSRISDLDSTWLEPNYFIDWQDQSILDVARGLELSGLARSDAVRRIGGYVQNHMTYGKSIDAEPAAIRASATLATGVGVCINRSRLFVALCRASGIPARTVSGVVRNHSDSTTYDFHHEWMEYLDEQGNWYPVDLRYSTSYELNDPRYAGFVYGAEDHPWFAGLDNKNLLSGQPVQLENGDVVLFHYHPIFKGARYGFELVESRHLEYYVIEKTMVVTTTGNSVVIKQAPHPQTER